MASVHKREGAQGPRCTKGKGPKDPGVAAPLAAAGCRGNCLYDYLRHSFLVYVSVPVSLFSVGFLWKDDRRNKIVDARLV